MRFNPHPYQAFAEEHVLKNPYAGLFIDMGLGKTSIALSAIDKLLFDSFEVSKVLVIAPKKVAESTWTDEVQKWDHLKHLKLSIVLGTERERLMALRAKADIYIINRENVPWLVALYQSAFPFDMVVIDELSSFKSNKAVRFKSLRSVRPKLKRVLGLTGTPAPNGLIDLWPQVYLLDQGERLGKTIADYRTRYFKLENPHEPHSKYVVLKGEPELLGEDFYENKIYSKIGDICISMKAKDYLDLPERVDTINWLTLPGKVQDRYDEFEKSLVLAMQDLDDITVANAAALTNKLRQFANGAVYDADRVWHEVHTEKIEVLAENIEAANGNPVLVFYSFRHDLERMQKAFKGHVLAGPADIKKWNNKEIPLLFAHPASAGHGLNLQAGGHLIEWFGIPWGLEHYLQAIARLDRQGQIKPVVNNRLLCRSTIDEDVLKSLEGKTTVQDAVMNAVKAIINKYK